MADIDVSLTKTIKFGDDLVKYVGNLRNTGTVFEGLVLAQSKNSGSEFLNALHDDSRAITEIFTEIAKTANHANTGLKEYVKKLERSNRV